MIPERLFRILQSSENDDLSHFPVSEVFNERWMMRLVFDAVQTLGISRHPLRFLEGAKWYSEARLSSPFRPRKRGDSQGEGHTNVDGVIGHFDIRTSTKSGLSLQADARQFVVVEAKMFSNLSSGTKNALGYNQAARNVACMAKAIAKSGRPLADFESIGFFVLAPERAKRRQKTNLEVLLDPNSIQAVVAKRISSYAAHSRSEVAELRAWEGEWFVPLIKHLVQAKSLRVLSWEECIQSVRAADAATGDELQQFYERCLGPSRHGRGGIHQEQE